MKYIATIEQRGDVYDVWELDATTPEDAEKELQESVVQYKGIDTILDAVLFEVTQKQHMPVKEWYRQEERRLEALKAQQHEDAERRQYERLRQKYGAESDVLQ